jgi:hypoxia-inducible factor (prolyl hydroxylase)
VICVVCNKSEKLLRCSRCKVAFYCTKEHQRRDWKRHREFCATHPARVASVAPAEQQQQQQQQQHSSSGSGSNSSSSRGSNSSSRRRLSSQITIPLGGISLESAAASQQTRQAFLT